MTNEEIQIDEAASGNDVASFAVWSFGIDSSFASRASSVLTNTTLKKYIRRCETEHSQPLSRL